MPLKPNSDNSTIKEFGLFVTSNKSNSHIVFGDNCKTPCGLGIDTSSIHKDSEVRWWMSASEFQVWMRDARNCKDEGYRLCLHCLKSYDKLQAAEKTKT